MYHSNVHCKKVIVFPVPSGDVTNQSLPGQDLLNYSRPGRVWSVTSRLGTGKTIIIFYSVLRLKKKDFDFFYFSKKSRRDRAIFTFRGLAPLRRMQFYSCPQLVPHPPVACSVHTGRSSRPPPLGKLAWMF